jgi:ribose 5-phosphate isomerase RpiB
MKIKRRLQFAVALLPLFLLVSCSTTKQYDACNQRSTEMGIAQVMTKEAHSNAGAIDRTSNDKTLAADQANLNIQNITPGITDETPVATHTQKHHSANLLALGNAMHMAHSAKRMLMQKAPQSYKMTRESDRKIEGLGLAGFICGCVSFFVLGIILATLAIVFGAISLHRFSKYPDRYKGKGFAIASLVIGAVAFILSIIALIILASLVV